MVVDGAAVASTVASLMMNGVCCVWQMQEDQTLRESIRKDVQAEYKHQRSEDQKIWDSRLSVHSSSPRDLTLLDEHSTFASGRYCSTATSCKDVQFQGTKEDQGDELEYWIELTEYQRTNSKASPTTVVTSTSTQFPGDKGRRRSLSSFSGKSLMDDDEDEDDIDSLVTVPLY
jgi:hypothetical protein